MTPEQIAALRSAAEAAKYPDPMDEIRVRCAYRSATNPATILSLLEHIAKLEAGLDATRIEALEEARQACATVMIKEGKTSTGLGAYVCEQAVLKLIKSAPASAKEA